MRATVAGPAILTALLLTCETTLAQQTRPAGDTAGSVAPGDAQAQPDPSVREVYRSEHARFGDRLTIEPSVTYTHSTRNQVSLSGFLALDAIFLGSISVDTIKRDTVKAALATRYDATDRLQLGMTLPYVYRHNQYQSAGQEGTSTTVEETVEASDAGDVRTELFYRWRRENSQQPDIVLNLGVTAPTGEHPFGIETERREDGNLEFPAELPTGNGVWAVNVGTSVLRTFDPAVLFANIGYETTIAEDFDDIDSTPGDQPGEVDLGDTLSFGLGTAFALNRRLSISLSLDQQFVTESKLKPEGGRYEEVIGSDATVSVLNIGGSLRLGPDRTFNTSIGFGVTDDAPDLAIRMAMPFNF